MRWLAMMSVFLLAACPPSIRRPESAQLVLTGSIYAGGFSRRGEALPDAKLTLRRADTGEELASNTSSSAGGYRLAVTVSPATRVVLIAEAGGFAPFAKAFTVGPFTESTTSFSLEPLTSLECVDTNCVAPGVDVEWSAPPQGAGGTAAGFEVELEAPVQVDVDAERPHVLALAFARLSGGSAGTLSLRVPITRWSALSDATPGTGFLEVAAATFDPLQARWARLAPVPLQSEAGLPIPESALPSLQRAEYAGGAVAVFPFSSERFIAVLGTRAAEGCVSGTLMAEGKAAQGALVSLPGTEPVATDPGGAFCTPAATGDALLLAEGHYAGLPYALGAMPRPVMAGKCGTPGCREVGSISVLPDALQLAALCRFSGRVIDSQGTPVANAEVVGFDDSVAGNAVSAFCGKTGTRCSLATPSGADGTFTLNVPLLSSVYFGARVSSSTGGGDVQRRGAQRFATCPNEPLTLKLQRGEDRVEVSASFLGSALTWLPPRAAARVTVLDPGGLPRWELTAPGGLLPPLTFGVVPADATQTVAPVGQPASGDTVVVELDGMGRDGVAYLGVGNAARP
ncbi:MAG: hypothetical protein Q8L48_23380 [Archangium sp.]|nr:hypothetical protein [Archangium sp.]